MSGALELATVSIPAVSGILSFESAMVTILSVKGYGLSLSGNATGVNAPNSASASGTLTMALFPSTL